MRLDHIGEVECRHVERHGDRLGRPCGTRGHARPGDDAREDREPGEDRNEKGAQKIQESESLVARAWRDGQSYRFADALTSADEPEQAAGAA
jgi:hypothetical protein